MLDVNNILVFFVGEVLIMGAMGYFIKRLISTIDKRLDYAEDIIQSHGAAIVELKSTYAQQSELSAANEKLKVVETMLNENSKDDLRRDQEFSREYERMEKRIDEMDKRFEKKLEDMDRRMDKRLDSIDNGIKKIDDKFLENLLNKNK